MDVALPLSHPPTSTAQETNLDSAQIARPERNKTEINKYIFIVSAPPLLIMVQLPRHQGSLHIPCFVSSRLL